MREYIYRDAPWSLRRRPDTLSATSRPIPRLRSSWSTILVAALLVAGASIISSARCQDAPKKKPFHEGNKSYLDDARWVHHKIPDMTGYTLEEPDLSSWCETLDSDGYMNGVEYQWTRTSDTLHYT